jgi:addiction module HigA family antidote
MLPKMRVSTHPGEVLNEEFLKPMGISQSEFAAHLGVPFQRVNEIINGKRGITAETAWLFSEALGTTAEFWTNLQSAHDLTKHRLDRHIRRIKAA